MNATELEFFDRLIDGKRVGNEDYTRFDNLIKTTGGKMIEYAKKLSMMARTEAGEKIRDCFIEVEKQAKGQIKALRTISPCSVLL